MAKKKAEVKGAGESQDEERQGDAHEDGLGETWWFGFRWRALRQELRSRD